MATRSEQLRRVRWNEAFFAALVQHSDDAVCLIDAQARVTFASPALERILGIGSENLIGTDGLSLVHPEDLPLAADALARTLESPGSTAHATFRVRHRDGSWRWLEITGTNLLHDPAVGGIVVNFHDVTARQEAQAELRRSEGRLRSLVQNLTDVIVVLDRNAEVTYASPSIERLIGAPDHTNVGMHALNDIHADDVEAVATFIGELMGEPGATRQIRFRLLHQEWGWRWVEALATNLLHDEGVAGLVVVLRDVTGRTYAEDALRESEERFRSLAAASPVGICSFDRDGNCTYVNERWQEISGLDNDQARGTGWHRIIHIDDVEAIRSAWKATVSVGGIYQLRHRIVRPDGTVRWVNSRAAPVPSADGGVASYVNALEDVTAEVEAMEERDAFERELRHQATHDALTGLPNRTLFLDRLAHAIAGLERRDEVIGVLFFDLDRFKVVNDSLGHDVGDQLLIALGRRLEQELRPGDTVARFGGDEFTVMCTGIGGIEDAMTIADRVAEAVHRPFVVGGEEVVVTGSIGIALATSSHDRPETLLRDADAAMYRAKDRGRARSEVFDAVMRARAVERLDVETALRQAIERDQLVVHYQPLVQLTTGEVTGCEALVRWNHPTRGLVGPDEFIAVAEETGLVVPLGSVVLREACRQAAAWRGLIGDVAFTIAVNLSARQLTSPGLVGLVSEVLEETGLDPSRLRLEITEHSLMLDAPTGQATLAALRELGVRLAIDDFGTGYSSLTHLRRFPVDQLKIDRSFVAGLGADPGDTAIVSAVVALATSLGITAVAEGVETEQQRAVLEELGCATAQGHLFARALPPAAFAELLAR